VPECTRTGHEPEAQHFAALTERFSIVFSALPKDNNSKLCDAGSPESASLRVKNDPVESQYL
jgi:hypothetical protein